MTKQAYLEAATLELLHAEAIDKLFKSKDRNAIKYYTQFEDGLTQEAVSLAYEFVHEYYDWPYVDLRDVASILATEAQFVN